MAELVRLRPFDACEQANLALMVSLERAGGNHNREATHQRLFVAANARYREQMVEVSSDLC